MTEVVGGFVETLQYNRFREFCNTCRDRRYIGLCYGPPGVGKTLSAMHYARTSIAKCSEGYAVGNGPAMKDIFGKNVVFYTVNVVNSPGRLRADIVNLRQRQHHRILEQNRAARDVILDDARELKGYMSQAVNQSSTHISGPVQVSETLLPTFGDVCSFIDYKTSKIKPSTALVFIDEADRLKATGLDQVREIFDTEGIGIVLIGMPGIEKRLARYPQLYSRVGFVHQFGPMTKIDLDALFDKGWRPPGIILPLGALNDKEGMASILRVTSGNFRLLDRLLAQVQRILEINNLTTVTTEVVEAARESLVIGVV